LSYDDGMTKYFATFPAGFYEIIAKHLKSFELRQLTIIDHDDSSVVFESNFSISKLVELRYFTNVFMIANSAKLPLRDRGFRLALLKNGEPSMLAPDKRNALLQDIAANYALDPKTHPTRNEFFIIERSKSPEFLAYRLPRPRFKWEKLQPGELRPEVAHLLCLAAGLKSKHIVLDPFAGFGAIPFEAVRGFGCERVFAVDSQNLIGRREHQIVDWELGDATDLGSTKDQSIDRIITDPPWGEFGAETDALHALYTRFGAQAVRVLKKGGVAIILTSFVGGESILSNTDGLELVKKWNVLISGKKATVFKFQKA
jgi:tRNA (guanine6-N2)-methyltransferase